MRFPEVEELTKCLDRFLEQQRSQHAELKNVIVGATLTIWVLSAVIIGILLSN